MADEWNGVAFVTLCLRSCRSRKVASQYEQNPALFMDQVRRLFLEGNAAQLKMAPHEGVCVCVCVRVRACVCKANPR